MPGQPMAPPGQRTRVPGGLQTKHMWMLAGAALVAIGGAVGISAWQDGWFTRLRFESPMNLAESPVETFALGVRGPIEVSAIRPYYADDFQTRVRAFVANHSDAPRAVAVRVLLRVRQASLQAPPLATFKVILSEPLPPRGGQEIDLDLAAMGSLQSLPP